jgi:hypothetical protein
MRFRREFLALAVLAGCPAEPGDDAATGEPTGTGASTGAGSTGDDPTTGEPASYPSLDERPCPEDSVLTIENFGGPFMLGYCTGCHHSSLEGTDRAGAPEGMDFDSIALVRTFAADIWARAGDQNATMPPLGAPPQEERTRLGEWLACGAP